MIPDRLLHQVFKPFSMGYPTVMIQSYHDGWLVHLYDVNGKHVRTIGGATIEDCEKQFNETEKVK